jgi:hypothetical protein
LVEGGCKVSGWGRREPVHKRTQLVRTAAGVTKTVIDQHRNF